MSGFYVLIGILIGKFLFPILEAIKSYAVAAFNLKYYKTYRLSSFESACTEVEAEQILSQKIQYENDVQMGFHDK